MIITIHVSDEIRADMVSASLTFHDMEGEKRITGAVQAENDAELYFIKRKSGNVLCLPVSPGTIDEVRFGVMKRFIEGDL